MSKLLPLSQWAKADVVEREEWSDEGSTCDGAEEVPESDDESDSEDSDNQPIIFKIPLKRKSGLATNPKAKKPRLQRIPKRQGPRQKPPPKSRKRKRKIPKSQRSRQQPPPPPPPPRVPPDTFFHLNCTLSQSNDHLKFVLDHPRGES